MTDAAADRCPTCGHALTGVDYWTDWCSQCGSLVLGGVVGAEVRVPKLAVDVRVLCAEELRRAAGHVPTAADAAEGEG